MNILVTGGSGFIGSHIVDKLLIKGYSVKLLDLKVPDREDVDFINKSILSLPDLKKAIRGVEIVYHLGGFSNIDLVKSNPLQAIELNIMGTANILEASRSERVKRILYASSVYVYDLEGHLYTASKRSSELLCKSYQKLYGLPYTILRYGTAYGPRSRNVDVVSIFVQKAIRGETIIIHGTGEQQRNFIYVEDLADASVTAMNENGVNRTYTIANKSSTTIEDLASLIKKIFGSSVKIEHSPISQREDDYFGNIDELDKTMETLMWHPKVDLETGIRLYVDWLRKQNSL